MSDSFDSVDCSPPGSPVHGILQARILEWVAISFSRGSSWSRNWTRVSCIAGRWFTNWATREACSVPFSYSLAQQILDGIFSGCRFQISAEILPLESDSWWVHWIIPFRQWILGVGMSWSSLWWREVCEASMLGDPQWHPWFLLYSLCLDLINMPQYLFENQTRWLLFPFVLKRFLGHS